jgi:hypothetical protein
MQYVERVSIDSCPEVDIFVFDVTLCLIKCDRLAPVAVGLEAVFAR